MISHGLASPWIVGEVGEDVLLRLKAVLVLQP